MTIPSRNAAKSDIGTEASIHWGTPKGAESLPVSGGPSAGRGCARGLRSGDREAERSRLCALRDERRPRGVDRDLVAVASHHRSRFHRP